MKAVRNLFGILIVMTIVLVACTTAKSQYEKGNYYDSVMRSVEKLRKSPNNKNARETLANAYPQAVNTFMDQLENEDQAMTRANVSEMNKGAGAAAACLAMMQFRLEQESRDD